MVFKSKKNASSLKKNYLNIAIFNKCYFGSQEVFFLVPLYILKCAEDIKDIANNTYTATNSDM